MNVAQNTGSVGLAAMGALLNSGTLNLYNGTQPANPQTALSGNTLLATATYASTAFGSPSYSSPNESATGSFTGAASPVANGGATFARAVKSDGTTVWGDFTVGSVWLASTAFAVGQYCTNGGNTYKCTGAGTSASSGGPTTTAAGITDGSVTWDYVGTSSDTWQASHAYAAGAAVVKGGNWYVCSIAGTSAASGGPSGEGNDITDGTVHWDYVGPDAFFDVVLGNCNVQLGTSITFTHTLKMNLGY